MMADRAPDPAGDRDLIGIEEAARQLEVGPAQVQAMIDEGLLTPVGEGRLSRAEVLAARNLGG